jgi:3-phenylpropionate/cinnamic acid dioxygenase small subunit
MTTTTTRDLTRLQELADRADITDLLTRQGLWLDERNFDDAASVFTDDATVETQGGRAHGLQALSAQAHRNHAHFDRTQHVTSNVLIDLDGDRATVRANLIATFVRDGAAPEPELTMGERYRFEAVRTPQGWRFSRVEVIPVWRYGTLPQAPSEIRRS